MSIKSLDNKKIKSILFLCMGNICRSPAAETIMQAKVNAAGLDAELLIDSAGTLGYHAGAKADSRMREHASRRGLNITHLSRQIERRDFSNFDIIIAMDDQNIEDLEMVYEAELLQKVVKMTDFCIKRTETFVPDPYYGGAAGFEQVLDILDDACEGLLRFLTNKQEG